MFGNFTLCFGPQCLCQPELQFQKKRQSNDSDWYLAHQANFKKSLKNTHIQNLRNEKWVGQGISLEEYLSNKRKADEKVAKNVVFIKRALKIAGILPLADTLLNS